MVGEELPMPVDYSRFDDSQLIAHAKEDKSALTEVYNRYHNKIYGYLLVRVKNSLDAEDLTSIVFTKTFEKINEGLIISDSFSGFIHKVADNTFNDFYRALRRRDKNVTELPDSDCPGEPIDEFDLFELVLRSMNKDILKLQLEKLTPDQKSVILLRYIKECSIDETAQIMNKEATAVKALAYRAIRNLRALLEVYFTDYHASPLPVELTDPEIRRREAQLHINSVARRNRRQK